MAPYLLTGASGYLGSAIAAELRRREIPFDTLPCRLEALTANALLGYRKVVHAAGALRLRAEDDLDRTNHIGTQRLLAALGSHARMLFISSRSVYGPQAGAVCDESAPTLASDAYAVSKLAAERALIASACPHTILRIPRLIGDSPSGIGHGFYAEAMRQLHAGQAITRYTPDREDDSLDVRALALLCADWLDDSGPDLCGIINVTGPRRSLHATIAEMVQVTQQNGIDALVQDRPAPRSPWPFLCDVYFRKLGGVLHQRNDRDLALACWQRLAQF